MLKFCALILLLPLSAFADNDCLVSKVGPTTSVTCSDIQLVKEINPPKEQVRVEFADGFTLFFHAGNESRVDLSMGERKKDVISKKDHKNILELMDMADEVGTSSFNAIEIIESIQPNRPIKDSVLFGGEVPWPIVDENGKPKNPKG